MKQALIAIALAFAAYVVFEGMYLVWELAELEALALPFAWTIVMVSIGFIFIDPIVGGTKREQYYPGLQASRL